LKPFEILPRSQFLEFGSSEKQRNSKSIRKNNFGKLFATNPRATKDFEKYLTFTLCATREKGHWCWGKLIEGKAGGRWAVV